MARATVMMSLRTILTGSRLIAPLVVGLLLAPMLLGYEPVGSDPDLMYRPIKQELSRSLRLGTLPFWSDLYGLGVPLVAESHAAAFYPPNWFFYRLFDVSTAYRLSQWLHCVALAAATDAYARSLGLSPWGAVGCGMGFSLCGFQAIHMVHEPFYTLMPYLPLCLLAADRFVISGRFAWLALLALLWGIQITIGHFQIQTWTAGLVLVMGGWRLWTRRGPFRRWAWLAAGLAWGAAIAWVQLQLTWELTRAAGFSRPADSLAGYPFPLAHWAQWALPAVYLGWPLPFGEVYWLGLRTSPDEAGGAYVGVVFLILACVGWLAIGRDSILYPWRWLLLLAFALATMPGWWASGYRLLLLVPGIGWFRAPARYTLLTSLGLLLLAGRALDRSISARRFWGGVAFASVFGGLALLWSVGWTSSPVYQASLRAGSPFTLPMRFWASALAWLLGLMSLVGWRRGRLGSWAPVAVAAIELGGLFYLAPVPWAWSRPIVAESPTLRRLASEPDVGLVGGRLMNLPVRAGLTVAYPTTGITPPRPTFLLESAVAPPGWLAQEDRQWQRRFGVTHGIWATGDDTSGTEFVAEFDDPALGRIFEKSNKVPRGVRWQIVRYRDPKPAAWTALHAYEVWDWEALYTTLSRNARPGEAWFMRGEDAPVTEESARLTLKDFLTPMRLPRFQELRIGTPAQDARVRSWDGRTAVVEHDGTCFLTVRRVHYPGWTCRVDGGPEQPVFKADGGLQCVVLPGAGTNRVTFAYRPTGLARALALSMTATAAALIVVLAASIGFPRRIDRPPVAT
jgi:hypothetical protein